MDYNDTMIMIDRKINALAEKRSMTYQEFIDWSDRENYRSEISNDEYMLIWAFQINQAIIQIETVDKDRKKAEALYREFWWIKRFRDSFDGVVDVAIKHLTDVCAYVKKKYDREYEYEWLLEFDDEFYFKVKEKKGSYKLKWKSKN